MGRALVLEALAELEAAEAMAPKGSFVALDFETATASRDSACALGMVRVEGGLITAEQRWLFRPPGNRYEMGNIAVHGIHPRDTQDAPDFADAWEEISAFMRVPLVVAHNAAFDLYVLQDTLRNRGLRASVDYGCTVSLSRKALPDLGNHRLDTMARHYGLELDHHDALSDARACANIGLRLADAAGGDLPDAFLHYRVRTRTMSTD